MTRWRALPEDLEPEVAHLVRELRGLKDVTELTLAALASKTAYSKSAWERYFNGKKLPPRQAVTALAEIAGPEHVAPLLALWQRATQAETRGRPRRQDGSGGTAAADEQRRQDGSGGTATVDEKPVMTGGDGHGDGDEGAGGNEPLPSGRRARRGVVAVCAAATTLLTGLAVLLAVVLQQQEPRMPGSGTGKAGATAASPSLLAADQSAAPVGCRKEACEGKDPQLMGCGQDARTAASVWLSGTLIELRYSSRCQAAWGRILAAKVGDQVHVDAVDGRALTGRVKFGVDAYSPMAPATDPSEARACATLTEKIAKCTPQGSNAVVSPSSSSGG
ncbi:helix-turn-helix domain-containing protein [Streptomyces sp. HD]|uniref:helix-turn-helix domain-containing protein n=1 Tax=Streptomyces sp. HD TaxID=3020892 RepID=UPI0023306825|nr:XRE family transcriptional regulator [Streptomyces sp. HD]MDC0770906.1 DUF2690 domain-containing protein [Streptomyces sp. HD]